MMAQAETLCWEMGNCFLWDLCAIPSEPYFAQGEDANLYYRIDPCCQIAFRGQRGKTGHERGRAKASQGCEGLAIWSNELHFFQL